MLNSITLYIIIYKITNITIYLLKSYNCQIFTVDPTHRQKSTGIIVYPVANNCIPPQKAFLTKSFGPNRHYWTLNSSVCQNCEKRDHDWGKKSSNPTTVITFVQPNSIIDQNNEWCC